MMSENQKGEGTEPTGQNGDTFGGRGPCENRLVQISRFPPLLRLCLPGTGGDAVLKLAGTVSLSSSIADNP